MTPAKLTAVLAAWASLGALGAAGKEIVQIKAQPAQVQVEVVQKVGEVKAVRGQAVQPNTSHATATSNDPAEPPMQVEASFNGVYGRRAINVPGQKVEINSGPRGTTIKVPVQGSYSGSANLSFKNSAPPMRFTTRLTGMSNQDLSSLTLSSGSVTLSVGQVSTSATTKYFNARGQEQPGSFGAAYTVNAKRGDNGQVDVEVRRSAGAEMGRSVTITWQSNVEYLKFGGRLRGG